MIRPILSLILLWVAAGFTPAHAHAAEFDITNYGATPDDAGDDTLAIRAALKACGEAGGGTVVVPAGVFLVSRQGSESPILEIPSNTTVRGEGDGSVLKFDPRVNESNFWRMMGASKDCSDITIRDLHLDGSNTHEQYVKGETPEQNHGIFFYRKGGRIENVTIRDCLVENFSGDCVSFSQGCRGFTVRNVRVRNFIRQGIQMGGGKGDGGHLVTGCRDLPHTVRPGGSTIHVEHAEGASDFRIIGNACLNHLLAGGGADRLVVEDNDVQGRIEGNSIRNGRFENNRLQGGDLSRPLMQFGYADRLVIRGNRIAGTNARTPGIYVWGASRYNATPSRGVVIEGNLFEVKGTPVFFNGVEGARVSGNIVRGSESDRLVTLQRTEDVTVGENRRE
ncbi:glycosyl hydrolase family 28-related protein [Maioricimonas sp. JC845]|uniref:glycosyl hydrolase family 28-related protein n=1 Tax=Maioricimonas sp. JC845 TaxID=3232138 RepID=UPI0034582D4E